MTAGTKEEGLERFREARPEWVFVDIRLPDGDGLELIEPMLSRAPSTRVLVITGRPEPGLASRAMKLGAQAFLEKPLVPDDVRQRVGLAHERGSSPEDLGMIGRSRSLLEAIERLRIVARSSATALILGESGTGKELAARAIHRWSSRSNGPFVAVNCAAVTEQLLESELFGYERGAFTGANAEGKRGLFEVASGGTILLDEIGETTAGFQSALLRILEQQSVRRVGGTVERSLDVRVVASTNRDLVAEVNAGRFRRDLFFRLFVVPIILPPLRDRAGDVAILASHLLTQLAAPASPPAISRAALDALERHAWPGNVRQLRNVLERAFLLARGGEITSENLHLELSSRLDARRSTPPPPTGLVLDSLRLDDAERLLILRALELTEGNKRRAAEVLGINRATLYNKLRAFGLEDDRAGDSG